MGRMPRLLIVMIILGGLPSAPRGYGQAPNSAPSQPKAVPGTALETDLLPGLPRPPDSPGSLFLPPSTTPSYSCEPLPGRYFNADPQLDPPPFLPLGWFTDVELAIIVSHFKNRLVDTVQIGS